MKDQDSEHRYRGQTTTLPKTSYCFDLDSIGKEHCVERNKAKKFLWLVVPRASSERLQQKHPTPVRMRLARRLRRTERTHLQKLQNNNQELHSVVEILH